MNKLFLERHVAVTLAEKGSLWAVLYLVGYLQLDFRWFLIALVSGYLLHLWWAQRSKRRSSATATATEQVVPSAQGDPALLLPQDLPAWVLHPDTQRANWANVIFKHLWPHLNEYLRATLRSVETDPQLNERLRGYNLRALRFPNVSLGNIPPKLSGVKVHKAVHRDEIILDFAMQYNGDLHIDMEVEVAALASVLPPASASITNMCFSGNLRVHLRPLLKDVPFIGGVTVFFLQPPAIDFDLGGLANIFDLPGINHLLRHVILDQLEQTIVMPNSVSVSLTAAGGDKPDSLSSGEAPSTVKLALPAGVLCVNLLEAKDLINKDIAMLGQGKSDPYAKLKIVADGVSHNFKTSVVPDNLHPVWKLLIDLPVDDPDTLADLEVEIFDKDTGKDDFLGRCSIGVQSIHTAMTTGSAQDIWRPLEDVKKGSFHAEVGWAELKLSRPNPNIGGNGDLHQGVLAVYVDSCHNLMSGHTGMKLPNPLVRVELCGITQDTDHVVGSVNPVFSHRMSFLVRDPDSDTLKLTVMDQKRSVSLGTLRFNLSDLTERSCLSLSNHVFVLQTRGTKARRSGGGDKIPGLVLSFAFRYIHRPKTSSFGAHKSLQDLHKIMTATIGKKIAAEEPKKPNGAQVNGIPKAGGRVFDEEPKRMPKLIDTGSTFGTTFDDPDNGAPRIPNTNGIIDTSALLNNNNNNEKNYKYATTLPRTSLPPSSTALPEIKVRPEEATEFVRNNAVRRSEPRMKTSATLSAIRGPNNKGSSLSASPSLPMPMTPPKTDGVPKIQLSVKYSTRTFTLSLVAHRAKHLHETEYTALPSPYVKTYLIETTGVNKNRRIANSKRKTKVQRHTVNPVFEETLQYLLRPNEIRSRRVELSICADRGLLGRNVALGRCILSLNKIHNSVFEHTDPGGPPAETTVTDWHEIFPASEEIDLDSSRASVVPKSPSNSSTAPGSTQLGRKPNKKLSNSRTSLS